MSADLFAEFNDLSTSPPPPSQQPTPFALPPNRDQSRDRFDFVQGGNNLPVSPQPPPQWPSFQAQPSGSLGTWGSTAAQPPPQTVADDDDGWGDFEVAEPSPALPSSSAAPAYSAWQAPSPAPAPVPTRPPVAPQEAEPRARIVRASTLDLMTNNLVDIGRPSAPRYDSSRSQARPKVKPKMETIPSDPNVLFDADDFELQGGDDDDGDNDEDDDEFGDFETVAAPPQQPKPAPLRSSNPPPSLDLLSLDDTPQPPPPQPQPQKQPPSQMLGALSFGSPSPDYPKAPRSPSYQERNPFPELAIKTPTATEARKSNALKSASPVTAWPSTSSRPNPKTSNDDDEWAAWDEFPGNNGDKQADIDVAAPPESWDWDTADSVKPATAKPDDNASPPVNVPPPSVVLSAFPDLLNSGNSLFKPISGQTATIKQRVLANPKAADFLRGYILLATTAARVIAGRKHRWHRDKILAKSMSISTAGSKGMKLAGVDKTQSVREDREAADVVAVWRDHVGRLRSAVAAVNAAGKTNLKVPELNDNLPVHTAKMVPTAPKPCIICGLKRDERITKVDHDVEDSFGEWWVEHWGHRACKSFWIEHEQRLRQR